MDNIYQIKIVYETEKVEKGYKGEIRTVPKTVDSECIIAPEGFSYDDATTVLATVLRESKSYVSTHDEDYLNLVLKHFKHLIQQYGFKVVEKTNNVAELYVFTNNVNLVTRSRLKKQAKRQVNVDYSWLKHTVTPKSIDAIYDKVGLSAPTVVELLNTEQTVD